MNISFRLRQFLWDKGSTDSSISPFHGFYLDSKTTAAVKSVHTADEKFGIQFGILIVVDC